MYAAPLFGYVNAARSVGDRIVGWKVVQIYSYCLAWYPNFNIGYSSRYPIIDRIKIFLVRRNIIDNV